jgi:2,5-dihydroxypyridine 5,6-dioxygenase
MLAAAKEMRVTSKAGTDLRLPLGEFPVIQEYGFVDEPGRWDHWPSGFGLTFPNERQASGRVVLDRGDILLPMKSYLNTCIEMTVDKGYVTSITGEVDADLLNDYMASFDDKEAYAVSHIGWGQQRRARWSTLGLYDREETIGMDARAFAGNFLFSMGPNNEAGGSRHTACHIDIPMRNCTVLLDNREVVREGKLLEDAA